MSYEFNVEKIERLEAELADLRQERNEIEMAREELVEQHYEMRAMLAEWQRHGVKVTEDCEPCKGTGEFLTHGVPCLDCGGTGKKLRDGAGHTVSGFGGRNLIAFPAEWLEATDDDVA